MKKRAHLIAGMVGFTLIASFWLSTILTELSGSHAAITAAKSYILWGVIVLVPALVVTGTSGMAMSRKRSGPTVKNKQRRMPLIALNGLLILVPSAFFLASKAAAGEFDAWFYAVQALELIAGATNLVLMALNIRDGMKLSGRLRGRRQPQTDS